ncbi:hypothetical protein FRC03_008132 [Tulasnella sp. 419]|nr:hypothetical protein FRC03_008132 [Tulasnella sp. 419]
MTTGSEFAKSATTTIAPQHLSDLDANPLDHQSHVATNESEVSNHHIGQADPVMGNVDNHDQSRIKKKNAKDDELDDDTTLPPTIITTEKDVNPESKQDDFHVRKWDFGVLPIPKSRRYHTNSKSFEFTILLNIVFGFASTTTVANLYYCQPLLVELSKSFGTSYDAVSTIPTITQGGYATGLLLITPLGDLVRRRPLLLLIGMLSTIFTVSVALAPTLQAFKVLSYFMGVFTVTPQIVLPFAADLAPPHKRASAISIVLSGLLLGIIIGRAIGGGVADATGSWRNVYWVGVGMQGLSVILLYWVLPDWPSKKGTAAQGNEKRLTYFGILRTMLKAAFTEPQLIQACLIMFAGSMVFISFWVTLTFLLADAPYYYSTSQIGLFGLIGLVGVATAPLVGRLVDRVEPWLAIALGIAIMLITQAILTAAAGLHIAAVIIACITVDVGSLMQQIANSAQIFQIDPALRSRLNAVFIIWAFIGQVVGSAVGTSVFLSAGWRASAGVSMGWAGLMLIVLVLRGPHAKRYTWFGYEGGFKLLKQSQNSPASA